MPGSDAERGLDLLKDRFNERGDGAFTLVVQGRGGAPDRLAAAAAAARGAAAVANGQGGRRPVRGRRRRSTRRSPRRSRTQDAAKQTPALRRAIGDVPGATTYLSGFPAINHDTQPIYNEDLAKGESIAIPIALLVMAFMFGTLGGDRRAVRSSPR